MTFIRRTFSKPQIEALLADPNWRQTRHKHVATILADMRSGTWVEDSPDTIKLSADGKLVDGRHRLCAEHQWQAAGGKPHQFWVFHGASEAAISVLDSGRRRSVADYIAKLGAKNSAVCATMAQTIHYHATSSPNGELGKWMWRAPNAVSAASVVQAYQQNRDLVDHWAHQHAVNKRPDTQVTCLSSVPMMIEKMGLSDRLTVGKFHSLVMRGEELHGQGDPILTLRNRLSEDRTLQGYVKAAFMVKTWNAWAAGKPLQRLFWRESGYGAEPFPQPIAFEHGEDGA